MNKERRFIVLNILIALAFGSFFYLIFCPDVWIVKKVQDLFGITFQISVTKTVPYVLLKWVRNYLCDFLWAYALLFAMDLFWPVKKYRMIGSFLAAFAFGTGMEILQISDRVTGVFDVWDILAELIAECLAMLIIYVYRRKKK